ncbi:MAG: hypothetical protein LKI24_08815 [Acidipropionibacterium sp.]|nr:hypothetical protein [Acidipropionibacterium sp.]
MDRKLASGWGVLPWSKVSKKLPNLIAAADTALAREKARAARMSGTCRFVTTGTPPRG